MPNRRKFLKRAGYTTLSTLLAMGFLEKDKQKQGHSTNVAMASSSENLNSPLRQLAAAKGKLYGVAIDSVSLQKDADYAALIARECSIATPNGELKWDSTEPQPGVFTFDSADVIANFCQKYNIELHGHTLLWNQALPSWVSFPPTMEQLQQHVSGVMGHYKNSPVLKSWDIANEVIAASPNETSDAVYGLLPGLTPEYILELFQFAASVDSTKLFYLNDTSMEGSSWRSDRWLALIEYLKNKGAKIDGAGIESHLWFSTGYAFDATGFSSVLKRLNDLQVKPVITELDIIIDFPLPSTIESLDQMVADSYTRYLDLCFAADVDTLITWGITDKYTWIGDRNYMPGQFQANPSAQQFLRPLPYDQNLQPKLARNAIAQAFNLAT